ncbi:unnamed protein product [Didymodactylos carnosus]|uniref:Uncharacterized protein n=1 Tax=Didymodactylos carnosus TaxID=1234261 RepID=A0A8S2I6X1_9BILA|nr:unnamed protein product [Didymodactylos carnosus]CAF3724474.1 unnamed protein product [Didymodactylos carnosus]
MPLSSERGFSYVPQPIQKRHIISNERYKILSSPKSIQSSAKSASAVSVSVVKLKQSALRQIPSKSTWTPKKYLLLALGIVACVILAIAIATAVVFGRKQGTITATTTTAGPVTSAFWSFDNITQDLYNVYNGQLVSGATYYTSPSNNQAATPVGGVGQTLYLTASLNQSVIIRSPFFNLSYTSFTLEAWIYPVSLSGDNDIFGQCESTTGVNLCLYMILRSSRLFMGFSPNYLSGVTIISTNTWSHVAYVYNYATGQQLMYLNGYLDIAQSNVDPYQGQNGSITIGRSSILRGSNFFDGYIDNLALTTRAKSSTEILNDATLKFYFSFDNPTPSLDGSSNSLNGTISNAATVRGRVNEALRFNGASSYFQMYGFYQWGFTTAKPFSIALWVNPVLLVGGVLVHMSDSATVSYGHCLILMGLTSGGQIMLQAWYSNYPSVVGPQLSVNTWTHIVYTYSSTNGVQLYVNGIFSGSTSSPSFSSSGYVNYINVGSNLGCCGCVNIPGTVFQGSLDELYVYKRELTSTEVSALANP